MNVKINALFFRDRTMFLLATAAARTCRFSDLSQPESDDFAVPSECTSIELASVNHQSQGVNDAMASLARGVAAA